MCTFTVMAATLFYCSWTMADLELGGYSLEREREREEDLIDIRFISFSLVSNSLRSSNLGTESCYTLLKLFLKWLLASNSCTTGCIDYSDSS